MGRLRNLYRRYVLGVSVEELDLEELKARGLKVGNNSYIFSAINFLLSMDMVSGMTIINL